MVLRIEVSNTTYGTYLVTGQRRLVVSGGAFKDCPPEHAHLGQILTRSEYFLSDFLDQFESVPSALEVVKVATFSESKHRVKGNVQPGTCVSFDLVFKRGLCFLHHV